MICSRFFFFSCVVFVGVNAFSPAQDEFFERVGKELESSQPVVPKASYFSEWAHALSQKNNYTAYKELYLSGRYSCDLGRMEGRNSLGFLLFGSFPGAEGQLGDLNVQGRATYYNNQFNHGELMPREYTKRLNMLKLELHNAYLRARAYPPLCNVRFGHFYVPFGLQPWIDTHGTLLQGPAMEFIGMERDWGVAADGQGEWFEYQAGLTRGSGMEYFHRRNNYALAGKLSTARVGEHVNDWIAVSYLIGRIFDPMAGERLFPFHVRENIIQRWRCGIDGQKVFGPARARFEVSGGKDARKAHVLGEFLELQYALGQTGKWDGYFQFENLTQCGSGSDTTFRLGLTYMFSANYNLQFVVSKDVDVIWGKRDTWVGFLLYGQIG